MANVFPPISSSSASDQERRHGPAWPLVLAVLLYLLVLAWDSFRHFPHADFILLLLQYGLILGTMLWYLRSQRSGHPAQEPGHGNANLQSAGLPQVNLFALTGCFVLMAMSVSWLATRGMLNPDESGYSYQARIYRSGRLMADPLIGATAKVRDTPAELHYTNHILRPFGWFPKFPPGWPLVLSLGYLISARWLPNAVFGMLQLYVIAAIGARWFSREVGLVAALLAALSPFYLFNSVGMMSHALCALLAASACLALSRAIATGELGYYAAMFACLAGSFQVRPYTAFVLTAVLTAAAVWSALGNRKLLVWILGVGAAMGALAVAGVLVYNHCYTGKWLVSPYAAAVGAGVPPELSLNPRLVLQGMKRHGPYMLLETALGAFPFLHVLAIYAVVREKYYRKQVRILAALYFALVLAYLLHPDGYAVYFGERFHFESFFALVLLAARGMQLVIEHWQIRRSAVIFTFLLLGILQVGHLTSAVLVIARQGEPYRKVRAAVDNPNISGMVFLHGSPGFVAQHFNLNEADWRHAPRIYLIDAAPESRAQWACLYGFSQWVVASYDPGTHAAVLSSGHAQCPNETVPWADAPPASVPRHGTAPATPAMDLIKLGGW
jgi:hypothetical protein